MSALKNYSSLFRIRFINTLQYRIAAVAGLATQFAWGAMLILGFAAFYRTNPYAFPMTFAQTTTYIWLQQASIHMLLISLNDREIISSVTEGAIAYEMVRPVNLYNRWLCQITATRLSRTVLRFIPVIVVASLLPYPYGLSAPASFGHFLLFLCSIILAVGLMTVITNFMYICLFYTLNMSGLMGIVYGVFLPLAGGVIPIPFFPEPFRTIALFLPFAAMQDIPLRIYSGHISGTELVQSIGVQAFWLAFLLITGHLLMNRTLKKVVVQGG